MESLNLKPWPVSTVNVLCAQVQAALKAKGLRDDITVLVIDAMPDDSHRLPPFVTKSSGRHAPTVEDVGSVDWHKPLESAAAREACASNTWWVMELWQSHCRAVHDGHTLSLGMC